MALPKQNRLKASRDFSKVYRKGKRASTKHLAVRALKQLDALNKSGNQNEQSAGSSPALSSCFGISISKKVSKRAVVRNRIKRQIRSVIRDRLPNILPGWQVVIVVRPSAVECDFADFLRELEYLLKKLNILSKQ